jgi:hypothetical protein
MQPDASSTPPPAGADAAPGFEVHAYPLVARALGAALRLLSAVNILFLAVRILTDIFAGAESASPLVVVQSLLLFSLLPGLALWLLGLLARARVTVEPAQLVVRTRGSRYEIPWESIAPEGVRPWRLPWPEPGLTLRMRSGRSFRLHLALRDPTPLLKRLTQVAGHARLGQAALVHPMVAWAYARSLHDARRWRRLGIKFGLFPLLPTGVMFRTHQYIAYGGTFGEYYLLGLKAYLKTFLGYWSGVAGYLLVYAGIWRGFGEIVAFALAWMAPARASSVRRAIEITCGLVYYVGFPLLVLIRFLV